MAKTVKTKLGLGVKPEPKPGLQLLTITEVGELIQSENGWRQQVTFETENKGTFKKTYFEKSVMEGTEHDINNMALQLGLSAIDYLEDVIDVGLQYYGNVVIGINDRGYTVYYPNILSYIPNVGEDEVEL